MKTEIKKKAENFWYHHKIGVLITLAFVIIFTVCAVQMMNRTSYDLYVLYAGPENINVSSDGGVTVQAKLESALRQVSGEAELNCSIECVTYIPDDLAKEYIDKGINYSAGDNLNAYNSFKNSVVNGKYAVLMLTPTLYEETKLNGALASLEEVLGYKPENSEDGFGIALGDTSFYRFFDGISDIPADTVLCLRNLENPSSLFGMNTGGENWEAQVEIFRKIVEFEVD